MHTSAIVIGEQRHAIGGYPVPRQGTTAPRIVTQVRDYVPPGIMSDPPWFLDKAAGMFTRPTGEPGEGTVLVQYVPLYEWGGDNRPYADQIRQFASLANAGGWWAGETAIARESGWITFRNKLKGVVHLGVMTQISQADTPLFRLDWDPVRIARQLAAYAAAVGVPYRATPGVTGCAAIQRWHATKPVDKSGNREIPTWVWHDAPEGIATPGDVMWSRRLSVDERKLAYVHAFDTNRQYLAAMANATLGWDLPVPDMPDWDPGRTGLWQIIARGQAGPGPRGLGLLDERHIGGNGTGWATTALLAELARHGVTPEIVTALLVKAVRTTRRDGTEVPGAGRVLRGVAEYFRDAQKAHPRPAGHPKECVCHRCLMAAALKMTPNHAVGMMASPRSMLRRADWNAGIRDTARLLLLLKVYAGIRTHGLYPIRVERDCVWYASDDPDPASIGARLGVVDTGQIGRLKIDKEKCTTMTQYLDSLKQEASARKAARRLAVIDG